MRGTKQDIAIQVTKKTKAGGISLCEIEKLVETVCRQFNTPKAVVSIVLVGDAGMRRMNKQFLNRNSSTDCLSFDLSDDIPRSGKLFELIINVERARKEAKQRKLPFKAELALYIIHALLHNLGFDDSRPDLAEQMHRTEDGILKQLGYGFVYNANNNPPSDNQLKR
jgi:probable rRNA maturation factor